MNIKYIGKNEKGVSMRGIDFPKDKFVDVQDEKVISKLSKNKYFEVDDESNVADPLLDASDEELKKIEDFSDIKDKDLLERIGRELPRMLEAP